MDEETKNKISQLEQKVIDLETKYKNLLNFSSIPIEFEQALIKRGFLKFDSALNFYGGVSGNVFPNIFVKYADKKSLISIHLPLISFYVTTGDDTCHAPAHGFSDGQQVILYSTGTLPTGLDTLASFYIMNATTDTFQLSTDGISVDDITDVGVGTHYAEYFT